LQQNHFLISSPLVEVKGGAGTNSPQAVYKGRHFGISKFEARNFNHRTLLPARFQFTSSSFTDADKEMFVV